MYNSNPADNVYDDSLCNFLFERTVQFRGRQILVVAKRVLHGSEAGLIASVPGYVLESDDVIAKTESVPRKDQKGLRDIIIKECSMKFDRFLFW